MPLSLPLYLLPLRHVLVANHQPLYFLYKINIKSPASTTPTQNKLTLKVLAQDEFSSVQQHSLLFDFRFDQMVLSRDTFALRR